MSADNLRHWSALGKTDPKHTKPFQRAGGFKGTATKPIWTEYRLTQHFGPCGIGWGCDEPNFTLVPAGEEILVYCTLRCWYAEEGKQASLYGVGGDKVLVKQQSGLRADDEAYKKAFTDALGNAFKHVGAGADVHMGLFEDSKYVAEVRQEFAEDGAAPRADERSAPPPAHATGNGTAPPAASTADKEAKLKRAAEARDRIKLALEKATTPKIIEDIINVNSADLEFIKSYGPKTYEAMMQLAAVRKSEMMAGA